MCSSFFWVISLIIVYTASQFCSGSISSLSYVNGHKLCRCQIDFSGTKSITDSAQFSQLSCDCRDAPYLDYFSGIKNNPHASDFHRSIAKAVEDLYRDLIRSRFPKIVSHNNYNALLHPISFSIPEELIVQSIPSKEKTLCRAIPGNLSTYFKDELTYRKDLEGSLFALTIKKSGWDCFRHLEILSAGCLPLFRDILKCPKSAIACHPKAVYKLLLEFPGLRLEDLSQDWTVLDRQLYLAVGEALLQFTRNVLSCKAMARYMLETMERYQGFFSSGLQTEQNQHVLQSFLRRVHHVNYSTANSGDSFVFANATTTKISSHKGRPFQQTLAKKVLYLTHQNPDLDSGDYQSDMTLIGMIQLLGQHAVTEFPLHRAVHKTLGEFALADAQRLKQTLYGKGFSWALTLTERSLFNDSESDTFHSTSQPADDRHPVYHAVKQNILDKVYDYIVIGSGHRTGSDNVFHFWNEICKSYAPQQVAVIDGDDYPFRKDVFLSRWLPCVGHVFSREGPAH